DGTLSIIEHQCLCIKRIEHSLGGSAGGVVASHLNSEGRGDVYAVNTGAQPTRPLRHGHWSRRILRARRGRPGGQCEKSSAIQNTSSFRDLTWPFSNSLRSAKKVGLARPLLNNSRA